MFIKRGIKKIVTEYIEYNDKYKKLFGDKAIVLLVLDHFMNVIVLKQRDRI